MGETTKNDDLLLKSFFAEVSEVERDNEVVRILSCFKLNPFEHLNLPFDSSAEDVKKQYRKLSLLVHPDKCKHPQAQEAFGALAKAQQLLLDQQERDYISSQVKSAKEELLAKWKKQVKKDNTSKLKSIVDEKFEEKHEKSDGFQQQLKIKVRELLTEQEWRRRKMAMRISEEEGRLKKEEEEEKEEVIFLDATRKLKGGSVDLFVVNSFGSAYQTVFICLLLPFLSKMWGIPFSQLPSYLKDGTACFLNINTSSIGCEGAPLLPLLFIIVNMGFNVSLLHLLKVSSAVVSCLASTFSESWST